jgi:tetratricopeptide (TPR) repeat protein
MEFLMPQSQPLCLVLMPFDKKKDATGRIIHFEPIYSRLIVPAIQAAGMQPIRAEEQRAGAVIHKSLLERLIHCDFVVADLTTANATVFYLLGIRHAVRPGATVLLFAAGTAQLPFDAHKFGAVRYRLSPQGLPENEAKYRAVVTERLVRAREAAVDSPLYRLLDNYPNIDPGGKDAVERRVQDSTEMKRRLREARSHDLEAVAQVDHSLGKLADVEPDVVLELFFAYRAVEGWDQMIDVVQRMSPELAGTVLVQQQLGKALNAAGEGDEAENVLRELIYRRGPSSESYGMLGRILKYRWEKAVEAGENSQAKELLDKAAGAYARGFEADWRDTYPGVNAVTLMELKEPADPRRRKILPVVHYAVEQHIRSGAADYWDYATLLELAVLDCDEAKGIDALSRCLAMVREPWQPSITARNMRLIREARTRRGAECPPWTSRAEDELLKAAARGMAHP